MKNSSLATASTIVKNQIEHQMELGVFNVGVFIGSYSG